MNLKTTRLPLYTNGNSATPLLTNPSHKPVSGLTITYRLIDDAGAKRTYPAEAIDGFQEARFPGSIGAGDQIQAGRECEAGILDIPKIVDIQRLQSHEVSAKSLARMYDQQVPGQ